MQPSDSVPAWDHHSGPPVLCSAEVSSFSSQPPPLAAQHARLTCGDGSGVLCHSCYVFNCSLPHCFAPIISGSHLFHLFEESKISVQPGELGFGQIEFNF